MVKPALRTRSVGFKVSEKDAQLESAAQRVRAIARGVVPGGPLDRRPGDKTGLGGGEAQALMAELVALRAILLNVVYKLADGRS
jgi:hypothetical protein